MNVLQALQVMNVVMTQILAKQFVMHRHCFAHVKGLIQFYLSVLGGQRGKSVENLLNFNIKLT